MDWTSCSAIIVAEGSSYSVPSKVNEFSFDPDTLNAVPAVRQRRVRVVYRCHMKMTWAHWVLYGPKTSQPCDSDWIIGCALVSMPSTRDERSNTCKNSASIRVDRHHRRYAVGESIAHKFDMIACHRAQPNNDILTIFRYCSLKLATSDQRPQTLTPGKTEEHR